MELRPRRGRSSQPPSTPTIAKPSPRQPPQSSARKKPAPLPGTPIYIPSDDEGADAKEIRDDVVSDEPALKRDNLDIIPPDDSEFETPLSSIAKVRRVRNRVSSSNAKGRNKVTTSVKKIVQNMCSAQKDMCITDTRMKEACVADDSSIAAVEKVGLDESTTRKVCGARNGDVALEVTETREVLTENVSSSGIERAGGGISVLAQEMDVKKVEVLSPSGKGKKVQSSKKEKSVKKRAEDTKRLLDSVENGGVPMYETSLISEIVDADAPVAQKDCSALLLILSDDETGQDSDAIGFEVKASASNEAALANHGQAEVSKASSKGHKSRPNKMDTIKEENFGRKLFEDTNDVTVAHIDKEIEDQARHKSGMTTNLSKEDCQRKIDGVNIKNYKEEGVISSIKRRTCYSPSGNLKDNKVADLEMVDSDGGASAAVMEEEDSGNMYAHDVSEDSSHGAVSSSDEGDEDTRNDHDDTFEVKHEEAKTSFEGNAVHDEECNNKDDDDNASSGSDDEDEMASFFVNSMRAHLQKISEPSVISMPKASPAKQEAVESERPLTKAAVKASCVSGSNGSSTGFGLSWSPDIVLSASKNLSAQAGKARSIAEARLNTIWGRDRCLQDGLCVPPVDPLKLNKLSKKQKDDTTGAKWFNLSAPTITPEIKKELQILKLRGALDPKRHYKAEDSKGLPKYFQIGTVVGGPADFYSGRLTKKEQKSSLANELLSDSSLTAYRKRKYTQIQDQKQAGGKGFWKKRKSKRTPAWAKI